MIALSTSEGKIIWRSEGKSMCEDARSELATSLKRELLYTLNLSFPLTLKEDRYKYLAKKFLASIIACLINDGSYPYDYVEKKEEKKGKQFKFTVPANKILKIELSAKSNVPFNYCLSSMVREFIKQIIPSLFILFIVLLLSHSKLGTNGTILVGSIILGMFFVGLAIFTLIAAAKCRAISRQQLYNVFLYFVPKRDGIDLIRTITKNSIEATLDNLIAKVDDFLSEIKKEFKDKHPSLDKISSEDVKRQLDILKKNLINIVSSMDFEDISELPISIGVFPFSQAALSTIKEDCGKIDIDCVINEK